ncbi:unnamed protein product [Rotaria magnacalcarata]|uniref:Uncharacterized protein n=1 Tax=Rotaria magnacalcarata TaxID=392030 RepID=A0A815QM68_9BILA|nr:unnamed protein product [Rotaria magnacalcarata]CAF1593988.1 unnamed protein product [Rotaria magnacalcarata]CAF1988567.1 unnamed protein product [Rotaria magnacalcarata]CAF2025256.1 unnamed protein product [Rotaria magnacalcarata]
MAMNETENDAMIAKILTDEYNFESASYNSDPRGSSKSYWKDSSVHFTNNYQQQIKDHTSSTSNENQKYTQDFEVDSEIAYILQIEEIVAQENKISQKTLNYSDTQLEKTHTGMTKALQPTNESGMITRIIAMFTTIQTRYTECQEKNQTTIEKIQILSVQLSPLLLSFKRHGAVGISRAVVPSLAIGLITNVLQGNIKFDDAKNIILNMLQIWNESSVWYEFLEQLVYILLALTVPSFAQGAMGKIMEKVSSFK